MAANEVTVTLSCDTAEVAQLVARSIELCEDNKRLRAALERIERWEGEFPDTGRFWDEPKNTEPMSYSACFGSNGERDYMRQVAREALTPNAEVNGGRLADRPSEAV